MRQLKIDLSGLERKVRMRVTATWKPSFIATMCDWYLQERLERAISGCGAFRYFKEVLLDYSAKLERWSRFKQVSLHRRMLDWLKAQGITPLQ